MSSQLDMESNKFEFNENCPKNETRIFFGIILFFSLLLNFIFLKLIQKHSNSSMRPYKIVLIISSVADTLTAITISLVMVKTHIVNDNQMTLVFDGLAPYLLYFHIIPSRTGLLCLYATSDVFSVFICSYNIIPFIYRYMQICRGRSVSNKHLFIMVFALFMLSIFTIFPNVYMSSAEMLLKSPEDYYWNENRQCLPLLPAINFYLGGKDKLTIFLQFIYYSSSLILISTYGVSIMLALKISSYLHQNESLSSVKRQNFQITCTLIIQAIIPVLIVITTTFANISVEFLHFRHGFFVNFTVFSIAFLPCLNPCLAILLISCYRRAIFNILRGKKGKRSSLIEPIEK